MYTYMYGVRCRMYLKGSFEGSNALLHPLRHVLPSPQLRLQLVQLPLALKVQGVGFRVQGSGFRVQGSGFGGQGSDALLHPLRHVLPPSQLRLQLVQLPLRVTGAPRS